MAASKQPSITYDVVEIVMRILKYLFEGVVVATAAYMMPNASLKLEETLMLGLIAGATFSILDLFAPSIGIHVRQGAGLGVGVNLVGGINNKGLPRS